jgi:ribonuclease HI
VSFGQRPFAKSIGIFILQSDQEKFEAQSNLANDAYKGKAADAMARFTANPKRTKLRIHVDATPCKWAFKVLNGSNQALLTQSGTVTYNPATVNTGEYQALIEGLKWIEEHPCKEAYLLSDSQTIVRQVEGSPVKSEHLKPLRNEAQERLKSCLTHTPTSVHWQPGRRNKADAASRRKDYWHSLEKEEST